MFELKPISADAIPRALARAERYRLLNEPQEAESICRDVLATDHDNQDALVMLLLSLTDQFGRRADVGVNEARAVIGRLQGAYERAYYDGVISERWGKAQLRIGVLGHVVYGWLRDAMSLYDNAVALAAPGNEEAALRWNACARLIESDARLRPRADEPLVDDDFGDEPPV